MYVTVKEAVKILGISQATVYREIERGNLKSTGRKKEMQVELESIYRLRRKRKEEEKKHE